MNTSLSQIGILGGSKQQTRAKYLGNDKHVIHRLQQQLRNQEDDLFRAERINKNFDRLIQLVKILGHVDTFVSDRTKTFIKKLAMLAEDEEHSYQNRY